jgi:hypothetical protein
MGDRLQGIDLELVKAHDITDIYIPILQPIPLIQFHLNNSSQLPAAPNVPDQAILISQGASKRSGELLILQSLLVWGRDIIREIQLVRFLSVRSLNSNSFQCSGKGIERVLFSPSIELVRGEYGGRSNSGMSAEIDFYSRSEPTKSETS